MKNFIIIAALILSAQSLLAQSQSLNKTLDSLAKAKNFNGTILINQQSGITYHKSFGFANLEFKIPNTPDTKYKVASITKLFTSVLIMQLVEQGKIDLNKTINAYLPAFSGDAAQKVTIQQLLNHTSGLPNLDTITSVQSAVKNGIPLYQKPMTTDQLLKVFGSGKLVSEPGKVFNYNNAEYIVLGKIIEEVSKMTYEQAVTENILKPLKMENSGLIRQENIINRLAPTYFFRDDLKRFMPDLPLYYENFYAAGAMYATATDILKFSKALFGLKLLKKESLNKMFTSGAGEYGYGVWVYEDYMIHNKKYKIVKRPGFIMGAQGMLFHILGEGTTIIILSNTGSTSLDDYAATLAEYVVK